VPGVNANGAVRQGIAWTFPVHRSLPDGPLCGDPFRILYVWNGSVVAIRGPTKLLLTGRLHLARS